MEDWLQRDTYIYNQLDTLCMDHLVRNWSSCWYNAWEEWNPSTASDTSSSSSLQKLTTQENGDLKSMELISWNVFSSETMQGPS